MKPKFYMGRRCYTRAESFADWLQGLRWRLFRYRFRDMGKFFAPWLHAERDYVILKKPMSTSIYYQDKGGEKWIPAGEKLTYYYFLGQLYRFWKGEFVSADKLVDEGLGETYGWDDEGYKRI